jgi:hypothetical protein
VARRVDAQPKAVEAQAPALACRTCRHYAPGDDQHGQCRRYPPAGGPNGVTAFGPITLPVVTPADFWCGEHSPAGRTTG